MKKFALLIVYVYAFCCPIEFVLNVWFGSSVKLIAAAAVMITAFYFIVEQKIVIKFTAFQLCLIGWAGLEALSVLWTNVTSGTYSTLLSYLMMTAFVVLLSLFPFNTKEAEWLIAFYSLGTVITSIMLLTMGQVDGSAYIGRLTINVLGKSQDPNSLAALILSGTFYSLYKTIAAKRLRIIHFAAFLLQSVAIFFTGSRGGLVAYVIALVIFIAIKIPRNRRIFAILTSVILVIAGYFALEALLPERLFDRLFNLSGYLEVSGIGRMRIWTSALKELMNSPMFGYGALSHFSFFLMEFGDDFAMHNTFLCVAFETGLVGLLLFTLPFFSSLLKSLKHKNALVVTILVSNVIAAFFLDSLYLRFLWNSLIFAVAFNNALELEKSQGIALNDKK